MTVEAEREAIIRMYEAFASGDAQPFLDFLEDDVIFEFPTSTKLKWAGRHVGKDSIMEVMSAIASVGEYLKFELKDVISAPGKHVVLMRETFRISETGEELELDQAFVYETVDGRAKRITEYTDTARIRDAFARSNQI